MMIYCKTFIIQQCKFQHIKSQTKWNFVKEVVMPFW